MIYLDNAATTLIKPVSVEQAVLRAMRTMASPGRGGHRPAMLAAEAVLDCRIAAAELFHVADPERIVFTMNATHALNLAIHSLVGVGDRVVISGFEHNSVTRPLHALHADLHVAGRAVFDPQDTLAAFQKNCRQRKRLYARMFQTRSDISCPSMRSRSCAGNIGSL